VTLSQARVLVLFRRGVYIQAIRLMELPTLEYLTFKVIYLVEVIIWA